MEMRGIEPLTATLPASWLSHCNHSTYRIGICAKDGDETPFMHRNGNTGGCGRGRISLPVQDQHAYLEFLMDTMAELETLGNMETLLARRACDVPLT